MTNLIALAAGTLLTGDYRIERVLGAGGFGVTYLAKEVELSRDVTIKEYFPSDFAARQNGVDAVPRSADCAGDFQWGLDRFIAEAQTLAKLDHPNIVRVYRYFRANNTGYMVLQFEEGQSFKSWLQNLGRAPRQNELDQIVAPLLDALAFIHKADYLHRDVAPDNIIIRRDGAPVLIDFGSARGDIIAHSKTVSALVKPGYSPYEQYAETSRQQGPWTDIYALGATLYHAVTGRRPPDSPSRMIKDEYVSAREAAVGGYRAGFLKAIDKALMLQIDARPQSIAAWRGDLLAPDPVRQGWFSRGRPARREGAALELAGADAPVQAGNAAVLMPPLPDAPGPQGGLLDFVDKLKGPKPAPAAATPSPPPAGAAEVMPVDERASAVARRQGKAQPAAKAQPAPKPVAKAAPKKPAAAGKAPAKKPTKAAGQGAAAAGPREAPAKKTTAERGVPARPNPVRIGQKRGSWTLFVQLAVALGLAGGAVAYQERFTKLFSKTPVAANIASQPDGPQLVREIRAHAADIPGIAFSEDGRSIVSASRDASLKIWHAGSGVLQKAVALDNRLVSSLALAGRRVATGHGDGTVALFDLDKGERIGAFKRNDAEVWSVAFLGSGDRIAAASHDYQTVVWDTRSAGAPQFKLEGHTSAAQAVAYSVHGPWIATGSADRTVRLYDADTHDLVRTYKGPKDFVTAVAFSPDGKLLSVASLDGEIRLYSTATNRLRFHLHGHKGKVASLAFSPNGEYLASAGEDGVVRVWHARKGRTYRSLTGHTGGASAVAFSPDSTRLASAGSDGMLRVYSVPAGPRGGE